MPLLGKSLIGKEFPRRAAAQPTIPLTFAAAFRTMLEQGGSKKEHVDAGSDAGRPRKLVPRR